MAKYLMLWEVNLSKTPEDPKAKKAQWMEINKQIDKLIKDGVFLDWGHYVGEPGGYCLFEGDAVKLHTLAQMFEPHAIFITRQVLSIDDFIKATTALP